MPFENLPDVNLVFYRFNNPGKDVDVTCFQGIGMGKEGFKDNLQWNDIKFIGWIVTLAELCGRKIVKA